jgi:hypothetical protein
MLAIDNFQGGMGEQRISTNNVGTGSNIIRDKSKARKNEY